MIGFKAFLEEQKKGALHVFDIDDTLFHTTAEVKVKNAKGRTIRRLTNAEFNTYKLKPGQKFDFSEFRNAQKFKQESKPIHPMINRINKVQKNIGKHANSKVIINTARADFDDKHKFLSKFKEHGVDIDKIHVHRVGNMPGNDLPADKKVKVIKQYIDKNSHKKVVMYDDSKTNLKALLNMKREYPDVTFIAFHVKPDGTMTKFKQGDE
jgi:hypothetical protein